MPQGPEHVKLIGFRQHFLEEDLRVQRLAAEPPDSPYVPIHLEALRAEERLTFDLYLKVATRESREVQFHLYLPQGEALERCWLDKLKGLGVQYLYLERPDLDRAIAYLNRRLQGGAAEELPTPQEACLLRDHLSFTLQRAFASPHLGPNIGMARPSLNRLLDALGREGLAWKFIWELLYQDYSLFNHSVNVAVLGMSLAVFLKKTRKEGLWLGMAGLFHDLGLTRIDEGITEKKEPLTPEEWETLKRHPFVGYRLLKKCADFPLPALRLVLEHHETADGSGYPQGPWSSPSSIL